MWTAAHSFLQDGKITKTEFRSDGRALSFGETIAGWKNNPDFRSFFLAELSLAPFAAFFWETAPTRRAHLSVAYEHVVIPGDALDKMRPDPSTFDAEFRNAGKSSATATFCSLGGDAVLVAPCPLSDAKCYGHLAAFLRFAPPEQKDALFQAVGTSVERILAQTSNPVWISTSGLGVPWLHVRLDSRPKYYNYAPYRDA